MTSDPQRLRTAPPGDPPGSRSADPGGDRPPGWQIARRMVLPVLVLIGLLVALALLWQLRQLVILAFIAVLFAAALHSPVLWLERRGVPRILAAVTPFVALGTILTAVMVVILEPLIEQFVQLVENLPALTDQFLRGIVGFVDDLVGTGAGQQLVDQITGEVTALRPDVGAILMLPLTLFEALIAIGSLLFLSFLFLLERDTARGWFLQFVDERDQEPVADLARTVLEKLGAYVRGQLILMTVVGGATTLGMVVLGVPFALPLGLLAFLVEAIPLVGPFIAAGPILVLALLEGPTTGLLMLGWLLVVQQAEGWFLTPMIHGKVLSLSPIAVLLAVFAGGSLAGIVGAIIAVPSVAVADVLIRDVVVPLRQGRSVRAAVDLDANGDDLERASEGDQRSGRAAGTGNR